MFKRLLTPFLLILFILIIPPFFYLFNYSQSVSTNYDAGSAYELPHPGIAPDHPLYFLKAVRDNALVFITQNNITKAQIHVLLSDKRIKAGEFLVNEGKRELAISTFSKGEKHFASAISTLRAAKEQGEQPSSEVVDQMKRSNKKHREILSRSFKIFNQKQKQELQPVLDLLTQNAKELQSLQ